MKKASGAEIKGCVGRAEMQQMVRSDGGDPSVASVGVATNWLCPEVLIWAGDYQLCNLQFKK